MKQRKTRSPSKKPRKKVKPWEPAAEKAAEVPLTLCEVCGEPVSPVQSFCDLCLKRVYRYFFNV